MLSIILDIGGGYLVARYVRNIWLALMAAILVGVASAVGTNMLIYAISTDLFSPAEIVAKIAVGIILHPFVAIISLFVFRRKTKSVAEENGEE